METQLNPSITVIIITIIELVDYHRYEIREREVARSEPVCMSCRLLTNQNDRKDDNCVWSRYGKRNVSDLLNNKNNNNKKKRKKFLYFAEARNPVSESL